MKIATARSQGVREGSDRTLGRGSGGAVVFACLDGVWQGLQKQAREVEAQLSSRAGGAVAAVDCVHGAVRPELGPESLHNHRPVVLDGVRLRESKGVRRPAAGGDGRTQEL